MPIAITRYEKGQDATYEAGAAVTGGRLARITGESTKTDGIKPKIQHTSTDDGAQYSVGAVAFDAPTGADVGVTHRGWQKLIAAAAIVQNEDVYPVSGGRVRGAANVGATALSGSAKPYGRALQSQSTPDGYVWVKVYT